MSYNTKFDIIIPCYNVENIIEKSIESVLSQEYPKDKFSIIAINDGSTDNTLKCLNTTNAHAHPNAIKVHCL